MSTPGTGLDLAHATALPAPMGGALPTSLEWQALHSMAETLASSDVIPYRLKRKPADVAVILLAAREYGIPPLMALSKLPVVNGTPAPMGELMVALVLRAGHSIRAKVYNADGSERKGEGARQPITEGTYAECVTLRRDEVKGDEDVLTFTIAEALSAGLVDRLENGRTVAVVVKTKDGKRVEEPTPWQQYPDNMLRWRAVANACRLRFPDVLLGLSYLPEELGAIVDAEGAPIVDGEPVPQQPRRAPAGTVEERTAQESADRALEWTGDPGILTGPVLDYAVDNGYADAMVTALAPDGTRNRLPLRQLLPILAARLAERTAPAAPQEPGQPVAGDAPAPPATAEQGMAEAYAYDALRARDAELVRGDYRDAKDAGLLDLDVGESIPAAAGTELGLPPGPVVKLGVLLMAVGRRLATGAAPLVIDGPEEPDSAEDGAWQDPPSDQPPP